MSEWWTYYPRSFLLFSARTYYRLFEIHNAAVWPAQILALLLGLAILALWLRGTRWSGRATGGTLAALWLLVAWTFLIERYDPINWAARYFAIGFAAQAALLVWTGVIRNDLSLQLDNVAGRAGLGIFLFALMLQPSIGPLIGRSWTQIELFGIAPDPTAVASLGIALTAGRLLLMVVPVLWCAITGATLATMGSPDWLVAPAVAAFAVAIATWQSLRR